MIANNFEISVKGRWVSVPALDVNGNTIVVGGRWLKVAAIHDEEWLEHEIEDPELCMKTLKEHRSQGVRADIFTFAQKLPATSPKYKYSMGRDSIAAVRTTSFKEWWEKLPQESRKNVRRSQKRGVAVGVKQFDDDLVRAIREVNNDSPVRQKVLNVHYGKTLDQVSRAERLHLRKSGE
ncbi:MAG: hypothetical protein DMG88_00965 [Acidobacteria bacterium]|nr:MAG: hypothetical protein DMG88_00965 [Acidobacteriota bacterium]